MKKEDAEERFALRSVSGVRKVVRWTTVGFVGTDSHWLDCCCGDHLGISFASIPRELQLRMCRFSPTLHLSNNSALLLESAHIDIFLWS